MRTIEIILKLTAVVNSLTESGKVYLIFKGRVPSAIVVEPTDDNWVRNFELKTLLRKPREESEQVDYWIDSRRSLRQKVLCRMLRIDSVLVVEYLDCFILPQGWQDDEWIKTLIESRAKFPYKIIEFTDK